MEDDTYKNVSFYQKYVNEDIKEEEDSSDDSEEEERKTNDFKDKFLNEIMKKN